jgi:hypothetical protein
MFNRRKDFAMCGWIALKFIGDESQRNFTLILQHFTKETFSSPLVPSFRYQDLQCVTILIDGSPKVKLLSLNLHEQLIHKPHIAQLAPLFAESSRVIGSEFQAPGADGFIRNDDATFGQQILNIAKA